MIVRDGKRKVTMSAGKAEDVKALWVSLQKHSPSPFTGSCTSHAHNFMLLLQLWFYFHTFNHWLAGYDRTVLSKVSAEFSEWVNIKKSSIRARNKPTVQIDYYLEVKLKASAQITSLIIPHCTRRPWVWTTRASTTGQVEPGCCAVSCDGCLVVIFNVHLWSPLWINVLYLRLRHHVYVKA